jgi:hypothetical protein
VSFGDRIYLMGGVVPFEGSPDPVNQSIRTTASVLSLDTTSFPLRWVEAPALHESREHFNAVVVDGRIWLFQGRSEASTHMRGVESMRPGHGGWRKETTVETTPLDATGADAKHGTYGVTIVEEGVAKILAPGGAATAWFDPMSRVHVFVPGE